LPQVGGMPNFGETIWQFTQLSFGHHHPKKALRVSWKRRKRFEWIVAAVNPPNKKEVKSHWTSDRVELFIVFYLFGDYIMFILRTSLLDIEHVPQCCVVSELRMNLSRVPLRNIWETCQWLHFPGTLCSSDHQIEWTNTSESILELQDCLRSINSPY